MLNDLTRTFNPECDLEDIETKLFNSNLIRTFDLELEVEDFELVNQLAYDQFAHTYERITSNPNKEDRKTQKGMLNKFVDHLAENKVLDIGCGVGYNLKLLKELGVEVSGVDISREMLGYASERCPDVKLYHSSIADFKTDEKFDGVVMEAFIHLFPKTKVNKVFEKVKTLMKPEGIGTLTTTRNDHSYEGFFSKEYSQKDRRFRRFWKPEDLVSATQEAGFKILEEQHYHNFGKDWIRLTFQK